MWTAIRRGVVVGIGVVLQILLSLMIFLFFSSKIAWIEAAYRILGVLLVLAIVKRSRRLSADLPWIIIILVFPIIGALLYIIIGNNLRRSQTMKRIIKSTEENAHYLKLDHEAQREIEARELDQLKYLTNCAGFPATLGNKVKYYPLGDDVYPVMLEELEKAKKFIFMEYFIIRKGQFWQSFLDILERKVREGVDVRLVYDDLGSLAMLPKNYPKELESRGIQCFSFNQLGPVKGVMMNNRDHRKMTIIDGHTVFSGGINLADEYINVTHPHGEWKDNGIMIQGPAVWNYTVMFLTTWNAFRPKDADFTAFQYDFGRVPSTEGLVVPYADSPLDDEIVGENVYLNIINQAKRYVWIYTPYLIIDSDMINALILAASRGVDVRIVVPGIPDKKIVFAVTTSYFEPLVKGGVKIYTYTPGFVHSKVFVCDDIIATVGTFNMDYRSLYLHFENGNYLYDVDAIADVKKDLELAFPRSHRVTEREATPRFLRAVGQSVLRLFAPLM
ncbi:MAG: cardiolipin synthase [Clostridia bacterium]|nr:cardiolipin synthase [Clostridia bacterium]